MTSYEQILSCGKEQWKPLILSYSVDSERKTIDFLKANNAVQVYDELRSQVAELLKSRHPEKKLKGDALNEAVTEFLKEHDPPEYGVWVFYPWSRRLVHLLPEEDFIFTRISPNNPKITRSEQEQLRNKKVGVVGLSVGQSISLILAMERICGELRIADYDILELANLNRIRAGLHSMGLNKCVIVAREIMEIDPFFKVRLYPEGMTRENAEAFFNEGGRLDLIVDECDSVEIKVGLRHIARKQGIPVVMDMSDRGTIDVERFDLEPERPILHGWLDHLDVSNIGALTNEEKVPYMMPIFGIDTISKRLKASMVEIGESIHTWPQLATSVAMGGALAADTVRRIFLDQYHDSGRYFIDLDQLISDRNSQEEVFVPQEFPCPELGEEEIRKQATGLKEKLGLRPGDLRESDLEPLITELGQAPSAGNNQPWKWLAMDGNLFLFHEKSRSWSWTDFDNSLAMISLGAALESLRLAAPKYGYEALCQVVHEGQLIAVAEIRDSQLQPDPLAKGIGLRCSNRKKGQEASIPDSDINKIREAVEAIPGLHFHCFPNRETVLGIADVVGRAEKLRFIHPQGHYEFFKDEMRWNDQEALETRNGLDIKTLELSETQRVGLEVSSDPAVMDLVRRWQGGRALEKVSGDAVRTSAAVGLVTCDKNIDPLSLIPGAGALRAWIASNLLQWAVHPISAPLFFINRIEKPNNLLSEQNIQSIGQFKNDLFKIIPILQVEKGVFMFRMSKAETPSALSLRFNTNQILIRG